MKNRIPKKPKTLEEMGFDEGILKALQYEWDKIEIYESPFLAIDYIPEPKFDLPMNKYEVRVRRKNGKIETHILYSDGSMNMEAHQVVALKKGDKFI